MNVFRILHVANFGWFQYSTNYYSMDHKVSNGLIRMGHNVQNWSYREQVRGISPFYTTGDFFARNKMNKNLLMSVEQYRPHLLLLGHSELITKQTLHCIHNKFPEVRIAQWWVDPLDRVEHIRERLDILDAFFATTGKSALLSVFGSQYGKKMFFFPNICDRCIETGVAFESLHSEYDLVFIGRSTPDRISLLANLKSSCRDLVIGHFGYSSDTMRFGYSYMDTLIKSRMGLNYSRSNDIPLYASDRLIHLTGNGLLVFSPRVPNMDHLFYDDEIVYYDNLDNLIEKIKYFHANREEGKKIAMQGWRRAHQSYAAERVGRFMIETIFEIPYSEPYEWESI
jgi:hypothetical protein